VKCGGLEKAKWCWGNYTVFYSGGVTAEKGVAVVLNDTVKRLTRWSVIVID
jgi:hypothetical protein